MGVSPPPSPFSPPAADGGWGLGARGHIEAAGGIPWAGMEIGIGLQMRGKPMCFPCPLWSWGVFRPWRHRMGCLCAMCERRRPCPVPRGRGSLAVVEGRGAAVPEAAGQGAGWRPGVICSLGVGLRGMGCYGSRRTWMGPCCMPSWVGLKQKGAPKQQGSWMKSGVIRLRPLRRLTLGIKLQLLP